MSIKKAISIFMLLFFGVIIILAGCDSIFPPTTPVTHTIISTAGEGGTISPLGETEVAEGTKKTFIITADEGYDIYEVLVDGEAVGAVALYTFTHVQLDHTIVANFILSSESQIPTITKKYTITATAGTGGSIDPIGNISVNKGSDQIFTITEDAGYQIADVLVDGESVGPVDIYIFDNVIKDHTIEASFIQIFNLTMQVWGEGSTSPAVGTYTYPAGTVVNISASPYPGCYSFTGWSGSLISDTNPTTVTMDSNKAVTANFELGLKKVLNVTTDVQYDTIQAAINDADVGIIYVCPGIYNEDLVFDNKNISVRSANPSDPEVVATTIIQGSGSGSVVQFINGDTSDLAGFTIRGGSAIHGGGVYIEESSPHIEVNVITGNTASVGGGIYIYDHSDPLIGGNTITGNTATNLGGGIEVYMNSAPLIVNNIISNNTGNTIGGGIRVDGNSSPTINLNTIIGNTAGDDGGGIHISYSSDSTISNNTIIGNTVVKYGGGLHVAYNSPYIVGNTIHDNLAITGGGGIYLYNCSSVLYDNSISGNSTHSTGGGIHIGKNSVTDEVMGFPNIDSNDIMNNDATQGGGIYVVESTPYIHDNTIEGNSAVYGGGLMSLTCNPQVSDNDFINNTADNEGGGIFASSDSDLTPTDSRPTGWGNPGDGDYRQHIPTMMLDPADGVAYFIAGNKFLGNKHEKSGSIYQYSEGAHVYFE